MRIDSPNHLLFDQLRDLRSVEDQLAEALPDLVEEVTDLDLSKLLRSHAAETQNQSARLGVLFEQYAIKGKMDKCRAMAGLIKGGARHLKQVSDPQTRDLMMVAHCLRIEQYEIAAYEITLRLAQQTGFEPIARVLTELLSRERYTKGRLEEIEPSIFRRAQRPKD